MNAATPTGRSAPRAGRSRAPGRTGRQLLGGLRRDAPPPRSGARTLAGERDEHPRRQHPPGSAARLADRTSCRPGTGTGVARRRGGGRRGRRVDGPRRVGTCTLGCHDGGRGRRAATRGRHCPRRHDDTDRAPPGRAGSRRRPRDRSPTASASQRRSPRARCWWTHAWPSRVAVRAAQGWLRATRSSRCRSASRRSRRVGPSRIRSCRSVTGWTSYGTDPADVAGSSTVVARAAVATSVEPGRVVLRIRRSDAAASAAAVLGGPTTMVVVG